MRARSFSLRQQEVIRTVLGALRDSNRESFRIAHYSVQENHIHLIVEAANTVSLSSGMRGLAVRLARRFNRLVFRKGRFWADRWHGCALTSPRQVRNALVYVLQNRRKHGRFALGARSARIPCPLDPCSSAQWFNGYREPLPAHFRSIGPPATQPARTWLLITGWRRHGRIRLDESPR